jgi:hypothetical protein
MQPAGFAVILSPGAPALMTVPRKAAPAYPGPLATGLGKATQFNAKQR